jgi:hypothetical protein
VASIETLILEIIARDRNASAAFDNLRRSVDGTTGSVDKNTQSLDKNTQAQKSALGGAIGLGVAFSALASPLAAAGSGAVAFAALTVPSVKKVTTALTGPGGLTAAWGTLDNRQRNMALGVQALGHRFTDLSAAMEPRTAQVFGTALGLVNTALGPFSQLAQNAGTALESFLVQFSQRAGLNQFITFMAHEAGPAIALLGTDITNIVHAVFQLLESWGGLGLAELKAVTTVITGITGSLSWLAEHAPGLTSAAIAIGGVALALSKFGLLSGALRLTGLSVAASEIGMVATATKGLTIAERGLMIQTTALEAITPFGWAVLGAAAIAGLVYLMTRANDTEKALIDTTLKQTHAQGFNTQGYKDAADALGKVNDNLTLQQRVIPGVRGGMAHLSDATLALTDEQQKLNAGVTEQNRFLGTLQTQYNLTRAQAVALAKASGVQVDKNGQLVGGLKNSVREADAFANANLKAQGPTTELAKDMADFANKTLTATQRTTALTNALKLFFNPAVQADQDLITLAADNQTLAKALDASGGKTKGLTGAQGAARSAFDTYISQVATAATDAFNATGKTSSYNKVIRDSLPILRNAAGGNKVLREEIHRLIETLKGGITERVTGIGTWRIGAGPLAGKPVATGGRVPGYGGGDRWPALLEGGEAIVPKHLTPAVAPFLKAHGVPGFAQGGVAGSYGPGSVAGLAPWVSMMNDRTLHALEAGVAAAVVQGIRAGGGFGGVAGPGGGNPLLNAQLAFSTYKNLMGPGDWAAWNYVAMRESGWNQFARNPTSGAYGIPQALPESKLPFAGQAAGGSNPMAQISWMWNYMAGRYGGPQGAAAHERSFNWYDQGGWLPPGVSVAVNNTGKPERVGGGAGNLIIQNLNVTAQDPASFVRGLQRYAEQNGGIKLKIRQ